MLLVLLLLVWLLLVLLLLELLLLLLRSLLVQLLRSLLVWLLLLLLQLRLSWECRPTPRLLLLPLLARGCHAHSSPSPPTGSTPTPQQEVPHQAQVLITHVHRRG